MTIKTHPTPVKATLPAQGSALLPNLLRARHNMMALFPENTLREPIISGKSAGLRWHMVMDPDGLKHVLRDRIEIYPKSDLTKSILRPGFGDSVFVTDGPSWRRQRRAAAPVFTHRNISALAPMFSAAAEQSCERLEGRTGEVDMYEEMIRTTFDVISNVTFSGSEEFSADEIKNALESYLGSVAKMSLMDIFGLPLWIPRPARLFPPRSLGRMKAIAEQSVADRRANGQRDIPDLLDLLMAGEDPETGRKMSTAELRNNILTFIVAGHETSALTMGWALYLLGFDQDVQTRLRAEAQSVLQGRVATAEDCKNLPYTLQVINETLRLYPPAAFVSRTAKDADSILGHEVRRGDTVMLPFYALHRHENLWDNPDHFDPDRFENPKSIDRYAFVPFGDGPRVCVGASFAIMELQIILATLISRYRFELTPNTQPDPVMVITLRPDGGVPLLVTPAS